MRSCNGLGYSCSAHVRSHKRRRLDSDDLADLLSGVMEHLSPGEKVPARQAAAAAAALGGATRE